MISELSRIALCTVLLEICVVLIRKIVSTLFAPYKLKTRNTLQKYNCVLDAW